MTQPTTSWPVSAETCTYFAPVARAVTAGLVCFTRSPVPKVCTTCESCCMSSRIVRGPAAFHIIEQGPSASSESDFDDPDDDPDSMTRRRLLATPAATAAMGTTAAARRHRADPHVVRAAAPHCFGLVPQSLVPQLGSTGVVPRNSGNETSIAGILGHGTKIRYISFPDVHYLYSSLPEPKLLDHGTKIRYISFPLVLTRYRTK
eukprot:SAG11_NODE_70_length_18450_cov_14.704975_17_plen_203_part_01